uniref:Photosystem I assembly protein Ycf4 n=1 Tax=Vicia alpestris TaxID=1276806 RepID=A0A7R6RB68_9FABA|nr:photosystem I assembly protein Ycf4 [Vicia alpestris]
MSALLVPVPKFISWGSEKHSCRSQDPSLDIVQGSRKIIYFFWASFTLLGSLGGVYFSVSRYYRGAFSLFISSESLFSFFPQGVRVTRYGMAGVPLSPAAPPNLIAPPGSAYNNYDPPNEMVYSSPHPVLPTFSCSCLSDRSVVLQSIIIPSSSEPHHCVLYKQTTEQGTIPLTPLDDRSSRNVIQKAWDLSRFMSVPMEIVPYS